MQYISKSNGRSIWRRLTRYSAKTPSLAQFHSGMHSIERLSRAIHWTSSAITCRSPLPVHLVIGVISQFKGVCWLSSGSRRVSHLLRVEEINYTLHVTLLSSCIYSHKAAIKNSFKKLKQHKRNTHTQHTKEHKNLKTHKQLQSQRIHKRRPCERCRLRSMWHYALRLWVLVCHK